MNTQKFRNSIFFPAEKQELRLQYKGIRTGRRRTVTAFVYIMHEDRPFGIPGDYYVRVCRQGYDTFGFDPDYLVSGEGKLVKGSTKRDPCPKTPQLLPSQTRLVAQGYKFRKMEQEALGDIPAAEILLSGNASASNRTFSELIEEARKEKNEGETNIFYWQEKALTEMKQELSNKEERLSAIEKMIGSIVGLGAATMAVLPVQAISLLLMKSYESHHRVCPEI